MDYWDEIALCHDVVLHENLGQDLSQFAIPCEDLHGISVEISRLLLDLKKALLSYVQPSALHYPEIKLVRRVEADLVEHHAQEMSNPFNVIVGACSNLGLTKHELFVGHAAVQLNDLLFVLATATQR